MKILGFDIGITSIGWAYVEDNELKDCGVRIFTKAENPKNGDSLATPRREARSARRRLARRKTRLNAIKRLLCKEFELNLSDYLATDGALPKAYETTKDTKSPYELRTLALSQKLEAKELARVILHIAKHRGYGNKHAKIGNDKDSGKVLSAIKTNETAMNDKHYQSVGEYLYKEFYQVAKEGSKDFKNVRNKRENYEHCVAQEQVKAELELIFQKQKGFGAKFSEDFEKKIIETAFYQRDLKSFEDKVGECTFIKEEKRAAKETLSAMEFVALTRIINALKNLEEKSKNLGIGEVYGKEKIQEILQIVLDKGEISYKKLREILSLDERVLFAKDSKLDYTKGVQEAEKIEFIKFKNLKAFKKAMGGDFSKFAREELDRIATDIALIKSKENLAKKLQNYSALSKEQIESLSNLNFSKHIDLSLKALNKILPFMREGIRYDEAVKAAGLQECRKHTQKGLFLLPLQEYEPYLANPVVARALSEYRKVLNALLKKYGKAHKIHLEFTREAKLSSKERQKYEKEQKEHFDANQKAMQQCEILGLPINGTNILKMKLWIEQKESCAYSDKKITESHLRDSNALQVDHIYPYSRSFDDSYNNKVLVFTQENQNKGNKTPFEAFGNDKEKWEKILSLSAKLPKQKQSRICNENFKDKEAGFLARNLNDTGYIARLASQWTKNCLEFEKLSENEVTIAGDKGSKVHIEVVSGNLTATLRHYWGLGNKDRNTHLHHALDAIILAYTNAQTIKSFSDFKKNQEQNRAKFYAKQMAESDYKQQRAFFKPKDFRQKVLDKVDSIFVSKPPRKRARGALHEETFYSFEDEKLLKSYGGQKGVERAIELGKIRQVGTKIVSNGAMVRVDIFKDKKGKFYGVPIYTMDFALGILPNKAVVQGKKDGVIKDWIEMDSNYTFCFSLFKDDLILVQKKEMEKAELCYFVSFGSANAQINVEKHNNKFEGLSENEKLLYSNATPKEVVGKSIGIQNLKTFEKYQVSPLGEVEIAPKQERQSIALKSSPKDSKKKNNV
ncbi:type II CRISPR RNA-guided endonuclease Cas9 [Helicobacter sp. MIT 21-1697]|uniref:type II CRISPR RNA-guided endonuclease Cas9 n=1 Tax=Helicobacter sp. MIT 21-1697 TaxID=2993733 RepID=UPI00224B5E1E|nr:type II CRISPR RNA-guided endonuclease Cas9 [Helicobacter sp. MIT 21-1697]MCX2716836.1 type II CRISPR RNA-guided endonuclease Cas9 [Helicobacter sp. MIT 21-1697]